MEKRRVSTHHGHERKGEQVVTNAVSGSHTHLSHAQVKVSCSQAYTHYIVPFLCYVDTLNYACSALYYACMSCAHVFVCDILAICTHSLRTRQKDTKVYRLSLREMTKNRHTLSTLAQNTTFHQAAISRQSVHPQLARRSSSMRMLVGCKDKIGSRWRE